MDMLVLNVVGVFALSSLIAFLFGGSEDDWERFPRLIVFFYSLIVLGVISFWVWVAVVVQHFLVRYW